MHQVSIISDYTLKNVGIHKYGKQYICPHYKIVGTNIIILIGSIVNLKFKMKNIIKIVLNIRRPQKM